MMSRLTALLGRAKEILQQEGLTPLLRRGFGFVAGWFFQYGTYYLYEHTLKQRNGADFIPRLQNFTFKMVSTNQEADELAASGLEFRSRDGTDRDRLDKGAIAFCVFVGRELVHIGWVAMTQQAKDAMKELPYAVDFSKNEACSGATVTSPDYRGMGLMAYGYFKRLEFLREMGRARCRAAVAKSNIASQRGHAKLNPKLYAEARYLRILWWRFWEEKPLT